MVAITAWAGALRIDDYCAFWSGSIGDAVPHRHFAAQAVHSDTPVTVIDGGGKRLVGRCLLIEPHALHRILPTAWAELWFVEPSVAFGEPEAMKKRIESADPIIVSAEQGHSFWESWLTRGRPRTLDARVAHALPAIDRLIAMGVVRLADAAKESGLSPGRFRHLFAAQVGMPFQRYVLWRRMRVAFDALGEHRTATDAAHAAGFSDSAHFARSIKAMFGVRASDLLFEQ